MARIVGIFDNNGGVDAAVEHLQLNDVTEYTVIRGKHDTQEIDQQLRLLGVPEAQIEEYQRRLRDERVLLFVQADALALPMVQRAFRVNNAIDVDLLPESGA